MGAHHYIKLFCLNQLRELKKEHFGEQVYMILIYLKD